MADIIKTWPAFMPREKVLRIFALSSHERWHPSDRYYFVVSRGKPQQKLELMFFTHQGQIIGWFRVEDVVCNAGQLPSLRSLENRESDWQIRPGSWVAVCPGPFHVLPGPKLYHDGFRGFRYFDLAAYRRTPESRIAI